MVRGRIKNTTISYFFVLLSSMVAVGEKSLQQEEKLYYNNFKPLWARMGLREARSPNLERCGEPLKYFHLSSLPVPVYLTCCSVFLLTLHLKIHSTIWPTGAPQQDQISLCPRDSVCSLPILTSGGKFLSALLVQSSVNGIEVGSPFTKWLPTGGPQTRRCELGRRPIRSP